MKRLCLTCMESWSAEGDWCCRVCRLSLENRRSVTTGTIRQTSGTTWWGPTSSNVDPEDLASGFHIEEN